MTTRPPSLSLVKERPVKRGRPAGSAKNEITALRDRVRTVATLNALLMRVTCADNQNQFAHWFDGEMRRTRPGRAWNTELSNKWRKNFEGRVGLNEESLCWLEELFPDQRYYAGPFSERKYRTTSAYSPVTNCSEDWNRQGPRSLYLEGPSQLWRALWGKHDSMEALGRLYATEEVLWQHGSIFTDELARFEADLNRHVDNCESLSLADLRRALVLYQLEKRYALGTAEDKVRAYLCVRTALTDSSIDLQVLQVYSEISDLLLYEQLDRLDCDSDYFYAVQDGWASGTLSDGDMFDYAYDPFERLAHRANARHSTRYASLSSLTVSRRKSTLKQR